MSASLPSDAVRDFLYAPLTNAPPNVLRTFELMCDEIQGLIESRVGAEAVLASARAASFDDRALREKMLAALAEARELIHFYHGEPGWADYQSSPEMKRINWAMVDAYAAWAAPSDASPETPPIRSPTASGDYGSR